MDDFIVICEPFSRTNLNERDWQIGGVVGSPARRRASARIDSYEFETNKTNIRYNKVTLDTLYTYHSTKELHPGSNDLYILFPVVKSISLPLERKESRNIRPAQTENEITNENN